MERRRYNRIGQGQYRAETESRRSGWHGYERSCDDTIGADTNGGGSGIATRQAELKRSGNDTTGMNVKRQGEEPSGIAGTWNSIDSYEMIRKGNEERGGEEFRAEWKWRRRAWTRDYESGNCIAIT